jgi:hypothetical protein
MAVYFRSDPELTRYVKMPPITLNLHALGEALEGTARLKVGEHESTQKSAYCSSVFTRRLHIPNLYHSNSSKTFKLLL